MSTLRIEYTPDGDLSICGIDTLLAACLYRIPDILRNREKPGVRGRLFPDPLACDPDFNGEWHEQLDSELHYLFVSAENTLIRDMAALEGQTLILPAEHRDAWISALNQARLVLGEQHHILAGDLVREHIEPGDPRDLAVLQVHVYGHLLQLLVDT